MLTREQLLNGGMPLLPFEEVDVPELGGTVGVQGMTAGDLGSYYKAIKGKGDNMDMAALAKMVVRCVVDEKRERIFSDEEWEEPMKWPGAALQRIAIVAMRLNSANTSAEGNLPATTADASSTGLH